MCEDAQHFRSAKETLKTKLRGQKSHPLATGVWIAVSLKSIVLVTILLPHQLGGSSVVEREGEEDQQGAQRKSKVQTGRRQEVEAAPPAKKSLADQVLKGEADNTPREVIEGRGGRDRACTTEDDGGDEVLERRFGPPLGAEVEEDRYDGTDAEEEEQARVDLSW